MYRCIVVPPINKRNNIACVSGFHFENGLLLRLRLTNIFESIILRSSKIFA